MLPMKIEIDSTKKTIQIIEGGTLEELTSIMTKHNLLDFTITSKTNIVLEQTKKGFPLNKKPWEPNIIYLDVKVDESIIPDPITDWKITCSNEIS